MNSSRGYLVYLMRLWPAGDERAMAWRASLENPRTGERHGFGGLDDLFGFLRDEMVALSAAQPGDAPGAPVGQEQIEWAPAVGKELYELIGRAITDAAFRARLIEDPAQAAREEGFSLTPDQVAGLKASDLQGLAEIVDVHLSKRDA